MTGYDVIGDVHGCADKLVGLLRRMGYRERGGAWRHPEGRQALFVGDLIDRGDFQLDAVAIPRAMVEAGSAQTVVGNHEFNALAFATRNEFGEWCRPRSEKNVHQHRAFLDAADVGTPLHRDILDWFRTLPLWLDLRSEFGRLRVVHACWHDESIEHLRPLVSGGLTEQVIVDGTTIGTPTHAAIEILLKGPELHLGGCHYVDKDGHRREHGRLEWWNANVTTIRDGVHRVHDWEIFGPDDRPIDRLPATPIPDGDARRYTDDVPVIFGHYWLLGSPRVMGPTTACVDYSAVKGNPLVAYRWSGEPTLDVANFVSFP